MRNYTPHKGVRIEMRMGIAEMVIITDYTPHKGVRIEMFSKQFKSKEQKLHSPQGSED